MRVCVRGAGGRRPRPAANQRGAHGHRRRHQGGQARDDPPRRGHRASELAGVLRGQLWARGGALDAHDGGVRGDAVYRAQSPRRRLRGSGKHGGPVLQAHRAAVHGRAVPHDGGHHYRGRPRGRHDGGGVLVHPLRTRDGARGRGKLQLHGQSGAALVADVAFDFGEASGRRGGQRRVDACVGRRHVHSEHRPHGGGRRDAARAALRGGQRRQPGLAQAGGGHHGVRADHGRAERGADRAVCHASDAAAGWGSGRRALVGERHHRLEFGPGSRVCAHRHHGAGGDAPAHQPHGGLGRQPPSGRAGVLRGAQHGGEPGRHRGGGGQLAGPPRVRAAGAETPRHHGTQRLGGGELAFERVRDVEPGGGGPRARVPPHRAGALHVGV
mmetsp:Transcript_35692/g.70736  ORF Transcript_35692/g.70736 Transcript_35692/m.70736 type:complete len:384 (+) Transcript_35692:525-1676(+)